LRAAVRAEDPALPIDQIDSADDLFDRTLSTDRLIATLAWGFGVLAITLAAVGIYGLLSYDVTRRTAEIGIRIALGARTSDVLRLVMKDVARVSAIGLTAGAMAALAVSKMLQGLLFQIEPLDPRMELAAALILAAVAIAAAWIPARRAVRMEPMAALRNE
jgi:ABC-type antimicrobial peptide transport system permease subunit